MRRCPKCGEMKEMAGKSGYCRPCHAANMRAARLADPEYARARDKARYSRRRQDPEYLEKKRIASRARSATARQGERFRAEYPGVTESYIRALLADPCSYCGGSGGEVDHIEATVDGGTGDWANLAGCCRSCNPSKGRKTLLLFLAHRNGCYEWRRDLGVPA